MNNELNFNQQKIHAKVFFYIIYDRKIWIVKHATILIRLLVTH